MVRNELGRSWAFARAARNAHVFVVSDPFEFHKFKANPVFGTAQLPITHLCADEVESCPSKLNSGAAPGCRRFPTFFESIELVANPIVPHSHGYFVYTRSQVEDFGTRTGWKSYYGTSFVCFSC
jgi:hypothetical protein